MPARHHVFRLHGIPRDIVSDRGPQFTSRVWRCLCRALGASVLSVQRPTRTWRTRSGARRLDTQSPGAPACCGSSMHTTRWCQLRPERLLSWRRWATNPRCLSTRRRRWRSISPGNPASLTERLEAHTFHSPALFSPGPETGKPTQGPCTVLPAWTEGVAVVQRPSAPDRVKEADSTVI